MQSGHASSVGGWSSGLSGAGRDSRETDVHPASRPAREEMAGKGRNVGRRSHAVLRRVERRRDPHFAGALRPFPARRRVYIFISAASGSTGNDKPDAQPKKDRRKIAHSTGLTTTPTAAQGGGGSGFCRGGQ